MSTASPSTTGGGGSGAPPILPRNHMVSMSDATASDNRLSQCRLRARQLLLFHAHSKHNNKRLIRKSDTDLAWKLEPSANPDVTFEEFGEDNWPDEWEQGFESFAAFLNWLRIRACR
ncbi:unnamed protein product [Discula destructiva]